MSFVFVLLLLWLFFALYVFVLFAYFSPHVVQRLVFPPLCGITNKSQSVFFHCCIGKLCLVAYLSPVVRCMKLEKSFGGFEALKSYITLVLMQV